MNRALGLAFIAVIAISSVTVLGVSSQSIHKPSVPEFTAQYVDRSYDIPPVYGIDPYTGENVITKQGNHVDNRTIEITIKNQPFIPFTDPSSGQDIHLLYNVRYKGSFEEEWNLMFGTRSQWAEVYDPYGALGYPTQSSSGYTTISYTLPWNIVDGQMDSQVEALIGYTNRTADPARSHIFWTVYEYPFYGEESGWSNTKTITIGSTPTTSPNNSSTNPTLTPIPPTASPNTETPTNASQNWTYNSTPFSADANQQQTADSIPVTTFAIVVVALVAIIAALTLILLRRQHK